MVISLGLIFRCTALISPWHWRHIFLFLFHPSGAIRLLIASLCNLIYLVNWGKKSKQIRRKNLVVFPHTHFYRLQQFRSLEIVAITHTMCGWFSLTFVQCRLFPFFYLSVCVVYVMYTTHCAVSFSLYNMVITENCVWLTAFATRMIGSSAVLSSVEPRLRNRKCCGNPAINLEAEPSWQLPFFLYVYYVSPEFF